MTQEGMCKPSPTYPLPQKIPPPTPFFMNIISNSGLQTAFWSHSWLPVYE